MRPQGCDMLSRKKLLLFCSWTGMALGAAALPKKEILSVVYCKVREKISALAEYGKSLFEDCIDKLFPTLRNASNQACFTFNNP